MWRTNCDTKWHHKSIFEFNFHQNKIWKLAKYILFIGTVRYSEIQPVTHLFFVCVMLQKTRCIEKIIVPKLFIVLFIKYWPQTLMLMKTDLLTYSITETYYLGQLNHKWKFYKQCKNAILQKFEFNLVKKIHLLFFFIIITLFR